MTFQQFVIKATMAAVNSDHGGHGGHGDHGGGGGGGGGHDGGECSMQVLNKNKKQLI
jgi:hypothetical protein